MVSYIKVIKNYENSCFEYEKKNKKIMLKYKNDNQRNTSKH